MRIVRVRASLHIVFVGLAAGRRRALSLSANVDALTPRVASYDFFSRRDFCTAEKNLDFRLREYCERHVSSSTRM